MELEPGLLVEINGLSEKAKPAPDSPDESEALELKGVKAQLVEFNRDTKKWVAATFEGKMATIDATCVRLLRPDELSSYDFVMGPRTIPSVIAAELAGSLATKGYAVIRMLVGEDDGAKMREVAKQLEDLDHFSRVAPEFEAGYLGVGGTAKTLHINSTFSEIPSFVAESPLKVMDDNFTMLSNILTGHAEASLGFTLHSRSNLLLRMPLADGDDFKYPPADIDDGDAEGFMHLMHRKKLTVIQFVGPSEGTIRLMPVRSGCEELVLRAEPHTILCLLASRYEYSYTPEDESLALQSFFLCDPACYVLGEITGNIEMLGMLGSGPPPPQGEQITMDGMYCRYGMNTDGRSQFWTACAKASVDGFSAIPFVRWDHAPYYDPDGGGYKCYTKHGCFGLMDSVDLFDCRFFEISPAEAKSMDPAQRIILEVSYVSLLEGGFDRKKLQRETQNIAHFVGIDKSDWQMMTASGAVDTSGAHGAAGGANAILSNRFNYSMNIKGASMTIDTACSSSLVCSHVSKLHLRFKEYDRLAASVVNGLNLMIALGPFMGCCAAGMLSHEGRCFTFNVTADGYARGELDGSGLFKLKNYDAESLAMLAGSQVNQDGRSASLTAPNGPSQERCLNAVLKEVNLSPSEVDCIECHGTGTSLGDPIEVGSFMRVMSVTPRKEPLMVTSSKSNIGHGEGGAGFAGLFKCFMQVSFCEATANTHLRCLNPHLDLAGFPCQLLSETVVMREDSAYSGVSSFGFGGTNAHGEAWGKNIMTSRGQSNIDPKVAFERKLAQAPPPEITMTGDDAREWITTGMDPGAEIGSEFNIRLDEDGTATWEPVEEDYRDTASERLFVQGTHNKWTPDMLDRHERFEGLWSGSIEIGKNGEEQFQIVVDGDMEMVYCPSSERCTLKVSPIKGPAPAGRERAWLIKGEPGTTYRIEFFLQGKKTSIIWMKE